MPIKVIGLLLVLVATPAYAQDERCQQLVALHNQYRGVVLTANQQQIKTQLVAWYRTHCTHGFHRRRTTTAEIGG
jgi:hypothetical protein